MEMNKRVRRRNNGSSRKRRRSIEEGEIPSLLLLLLPIQLLIEIFSRLPIKSIFLCRCVCKKFLDLLLTTDFINAHLAITIPGLIIRPNFKRMIFRNPKAKEVFLVDLKAADICHCKAGTMLNTTSKFLSFFNHAYIPADSRNGLLCLRDLLFGNPVYILNPVTGDYITIPKTFTKRPAGLVHFQFGFCSKTNQYKVLRFFGIHTQSGRAHTPATMLFGAEVYTLGTDSWRSTGGTINPPRVGVYDSFLNGFFHWFVFRPTSSEFICSFDLTKETFQPFPPPSQFDQSYWDRMDRMQLGTFDDHLCICYYPGDRYEIWMMKEYGIQESWCNQFIFDAPVIDALVINDPSWNFYLPIKVLDNSNILLLCSNNTLATHTFGVRGFKSVTFQGKRSLYQAFPHIPSFVSFMDIAMGENLRVYNVRQRLHHSMEYETWARWPNER